MAKTTNVEKQRLYRLRRNADPAKREAYLLKKKQKYKNDVKEGKRKPIKDLTDREKRKQRNIWRRNKRASRNNLAQKSMLTPPSSPDGELPQQSSSRQRCGRQKIRRDRAKCYRKQALLEAALDNERRAANRYKQKYYRLLQSVSNAVSGSPSPRSKTKNLLRNWRNASVKKRVKRTLDFHHAVLADFKDRYRNTANEPLKRLMSSAVCGQIVKKYKFLRRAQENFKISGHCTVGNADARSQNQKRNVKVNPVISLCREFYTRDDVSRMTTGRKNTVTKCKVKMQKRLLTDTLLNLHRKFISENTFQISYSYFCKLRPFYVVEPTELDRQTCQCKLHENLQFMADKLKQNGAIATTDLEAIIGGLVCSLDSKECAYGDCVICKDKKYPVEFEQVSDASISVVYKQWVLKKVARQGEDVEGNNQFMNITEKAEVGSTLEELINDFQCGLVRFKKHQFNIKNQYKAYKYLRESLKASVYFT